MNYLLWGVVLVIAIGAFLLGRSLEKLRVKDQRDEAREVIKKDLEIFLDVEARKRAVLEDKTAEARIAEPDEAARLFKEAKEAWEKE